MEQTCNPRAQTDADDSQVWGYPQLQCESGASLSYMRACYKKRTNRLCDKYLVPAPIKEKVPSWSLKWPKCRQPPPTRQYLSFLLRNAAEQFLMLSPYLRHSFLAACLFLYLSLSLFIPLSSSLSLSLCLSLSLQALTMQARLDWDFRLVLSLSGISVTGVSRQPQIPECFRPVLGLKVETS